MTRVLPLIYDSDDLPPAHVLGYVSVEGAASVFGDGAAASLASTEAFHGKKGDREKVARNLKKAGLEIVAESPLGFAVSAPPAAYEELTGGRVVTRECLMGADTGWFRYVTHLDIVGSGQPATLGVGYAASKAAKIDGILLERPRFLHGVRTFGAPSPVPPTTAKYHLRVPADLGVRLDTALLHRAGVRGDGMLVAMPDSGHYKHPYFLAHGYEFKPTMTVVPGTDPAKDPVGHGTGESANIFAAAPGAILQAIRTSNNRGDLVGAMSGFLKAKSLKPSIITCSWGGDFPYPNPPPLDEADKATALEIAHAVEQGIVVIFSAGNGQFSLEPQVPGVIAAGGVYVSPGGARRASDYASGYKSPWFADVTVPTVCGLVGLLPRAQYLMLPVPAGCQLDVSESQDEADEAGDGTRPDDGWALFSGTSAAAPQLAGVAALILSVKPKAHPKQVAEAMCKTAVDVTMGTCHPRFNNPATVGHDLATGYGLVSAKAAVDYAEAKF